MGSYHALVGSVIFLRALLDLDAQVARSIQGKRCPLCRGPLHWAPYPRVPLGLVPTELLEDFSRRLSFCCGAPDCRKRTTPPSVCFLGRRQYIAATFVILSMLRHGVERQFALEFHAVIPVDARTLQRWRLWWCRQLPATGFWRLGAAQLKAPVLASTLPESLVTCFLGDAATSLMNCLRFLSPLSTTSCRTGSGSAMVS